MSAPEPTLEERLARLEAVVGEAQAHGAVALIALGEALPVIVSDHLEPAALVEDLRRRTRERIEPFLSQPQTRLAGERMLALVDRVFLHAGQPFRRKN